MAKSNTKTAAAATISISDRTWLGQQSWNRQVIESIGAARLRYTLKCDSYSFQSYARVELWRNGEWSEVHRIPGEAMQTRASYVNPNVKPSAFDADIAELRTVAALVLA